MEARTLTPPADKPPIAGRFLPQEEMLATDDTRLVVAAEVGSERSLLLRELVQPDRDPSFPERFELEARRLMAVDHPSIPRLLDTARDGNTYYLVPEFVGGEPLVRFRERDPETVRARAETWTNALAEILENLHERTPAFVVGDFGPEDILVTGMGRLRFLPLRRENLRAPDSLGDSAPVAAAEAHELPEYVDVHRLVCLAWWMLTGDVPIMGQAPPPLDPADHPDLTPGWLRGLQAALDPDYPDPPQTASQLRTMLQGQDTVSSERPPKMVFEVADIRHLEDSKGRVVVQGVLRVRNLGGGELNGHCRSTQRWVRVVPATFRGNKIDLEFWIDSTGMQASAEHRAHIFLRSQNSEVDIPVQVTTPPHWISSLPAFLAALVPLIPGSLVLFILSLLLFVGLQSAEATLTELNKAPLGPTLSEALLRARVPRGHSGPMDARVSIALFLACFALCPMAVRGIVRCYSPRQQSLFAAFEIVGLLAPVIWLAFLWDRPFFNHVVMTHPDFTVLDVRGDNLWKFVTVNLLFSVWCFSLLQRQLAPLLADREGVRHAVKWILNTVLVILMASVIFSG